jgi:hypothetical protein
MLYSPSSEIHAHMRVELAGVFIDRSLNAPHKWLVAKLPVNLIREIRAGAAVSLMAWMVEVDGNLIPAFGLKVYDDEASPFACFGSCRNDGEAADLRTVLASGGFPLQFHNENLYPLLSMECRFDAKLARVVLSMVPSALLPGEQGFRFREQANDVVEELVRGNVDPRIKASSELPLTFENVEALKVHVAGSGEITLDDPDEGKELERLTFQALDSLFPFGTFHSPQVGEGKKRRELCDVLAVSRVREVENEGVFVIENKAASASTVGLKRETSRRAKSIQKNIMNGIGKVKAAIKALRAGNPIYRLADGKSVEVDPPECAGAVEPLNLKERAGQIGQGIVVISEMHHKVDWEAVFFALGKVFLSTRYYCHVLDLRELARLITHSKGRPAILEGLLLERGRKMLENKTAFVRFHFAGGKY